MHEEGTFRRSRRPRLQLIILIKSSFILNKLTKKTKHYFNLILHKIVSIKEIIHAYVCK